jgi:uncharacterized membrane protein (UPF0127 family)
MNYMNPRSNLSRQLALCILCSTLVTASVAATPSAGALQSVYPDWPHSALEIRTASGRHWFNIDTADTPARQEQGLMHVAAMPADQGMIFPLEPPRVMYMWMKNTVMSLDMLFIDARGRIACVRERAEPYSEAIITCAQPVRAVLEINAGEAARRGIRAGDTVSYRLFKP